MYDIKTCIIFPVFTHNYCVCFQAYLGSADFGNGVDQVETMKRRHEAFEKVLDVQEEKVRLALPESLELCMQSLLHTTGTNNFHLLKMSLQGTCRKSTQYSLRGMI